MEDNFYQASSERLLPKSSKANERFQKEKQAYEKESPIISETIERLKAQIAFYESVHSIKTENNPEQFMREVAVSKRIVQILDKEVKRLERIAKVYSK